MRARSGVFVVAAVSAFVLGASRDAASDDAVPISCATVSADWIDRARVSLPTVGSKLRLVASATDFEGGADLTALKHDVSVTRAMARTFQQCAPDCATEAAKDVSYSRCYAVALRAARGSTAQAQQACQTTFSNVKAQCESDRVAVVKPADDAVAAVTAAIDAEERCRSSPPCMTARAKAREAKALAAVCFAMQSRAQNATALARERANPSGVVNLKLVHDLGAAIQSIDAQLPGLKADYTRLTHKAFDQRACLPSN